MRIIASFVFLVIILSAPALLQANEPAHRSYGFSAGIQLGFIHGQSFELVYPIPNDTKGELLSELIWDMKPVFYYGLTADFGKIDPLDDPGFFASLSFKAGIPADSGIMEDRDWLSNKDSALTNFSSHTNRTREMFTADITIGASIPVKSLFYIKPFFSGSWMRFSFSGSDGYRTYAYENWEVIPFDGVVITYSQDWFLIATGFTVGTNLFYPFAFNLSLQISPFTYCYAVDTHLLLQPVHTFYDLTAWGFYIEPKGSVSVFLSMFEISLEAAFRKIGNTRGDSYVQIKGSDTGFLSANEAGAGLSLFDLRLTGKVHF